MTDPATAPSPRAPRFDLVVFDWDGTLFDSTTLIARCLQAACADVGQPVPSETDARYVIGLGLGLVAAGHLLLQFPRVQPPSTQMQLLIGVLLCTQLLSAVLVLQQRAGSRPMSALLLVTVGVVVLGQLVPPSGLSGGNVDPLLLGNLIRHGLSSGGRYLNIGCVIPDRPGGLARLLTGLADLGANVLEVAHQRTSTTLHVGEVEVRLQLETRGAEHAETVLTQLREHGYRVVD